MQSTLGSARSTRGRAQDLVDDATRIAEHQAEAAAAVPERVRGAIGDRRFATRDDIGRLRARIDALQARVDRLEGKPRSQAKPKPRPSAKPKPKPKPKRSTSGTPSRKPAAAKQSTSRPPGSSSKKS